MALVGEGLGGSELAAASGRGSPIAAVVWDYAEGRARAGREKSRIARRGTTTAALVVVVKV